jgi:hypothetical protein
MQRERSREKNALHKGRVLNSSVGYGKGPLLQELQSGPTNLVASHDALPHCGVCVCTTGDVTRIEAYCSVCEMCTAGWEVTHRP